MATEIELKLKLLPSAARALPGHPLLAGQAPQHRRLLNTYYDTPDLLLKKRRVALRFRKIGRQWLLTVKSAEPASGGLAVRSEWEYPAVPGVFDFAPVEAPELRAELEAAAPSLVPIFTTDFRRSTWTVAYGESTIEVALDRGHVASQGRQAPLGEVELELVTGKVADLFAVARELQERCHLHPSVASKAERGYALFADEPAAAFKARPLPLTAEMTPVEAFRSIALGCLEHLQRNEEGLAKGEQPEFVHQARVALRRLRSALRLFSPILPANFVDAYGQAWRTLGTSLGTARNWDVFVNETLPPLLAAFPDDRSARRLAKEGRRRARSAHRAVAAMLTLPEYPRLLLEFTAALLALPDTAAPTTTEFARERLAGHARKARQLATRHHALGAAERHQLRIRFKKLRYALEFFAPLLPPRRLKPYLAALTQLQNELGRINDHVTAEALIAEVLDSRASGPVRGWIAGRHALLLAELPEALDIWMMQKAPWKNL
ncbi:MAG: adenylate cyclase [Rhodocyclaceae bacterium]|nr:adenylate cyclase [Rhodocyclaceae bacterium]